MKLLFIVLIFFTTFIGYSQKLPDQLDQRPDGITITYFDYSDQKNIISTEAFLGENMKFKFPAHKNYDRIDISKKTVEIESIQKNLTVDLINKLTQCCSRKNCPDTIKGYILMIKKGADTKYITVDHKFVALNLCGAESLDKIIDAFKKL